MGISDYYKQFLGRDADEEGLNYYQSQVDSGAMTEQQVADAISGSSEAQVYNIYQDELGRTPDSDGMSFYKSLIDTGSQTADQIRTTIDSSDEGVGYDYSQLNPTGSGTDALATDSSTIELNQQLYDAIANLQNIAAQNAPTATTVDTTYTSPQVSQYYDVSQLQDDVLSGIQAAVNEEYGSAQNSLLETLANTGMYRSSTNLDRQVDLEGERLDAIAKGYGDTALAIAGLQNESAIAQGQLDAGNNELNATLAQYDAEVQNAFSQGNYELLMQMAATDQDTVNQAAQYNVEIQSVYDEIRFKWAASLLDQDIRDYTAYLDYLKNYENLRADVLNTVPDSPAVTYGG